MLEKLLKVDPQISQIKPFPLSFAVETFPFIGRLSVVTCDPLVSKLTDLFSGWVVFAVGLRLRSRRVAGVLARYVRFPSEEQRTVGCIQATHNTRKYCMLPGPKLSRGPFQTSGMGVSSYLLGSVSEWWVKCSCNFPSLGKVCPQSVHFTGSLDESCVRQRWQAREIFETKLLLHCSHVYFPVNRSIDTQSDVKVTCVAMTCLLFFKRKCYFEFIFIIEIFRNRVTETA